MTAFPGSPKLKKGAIIGMDPFNPLASVVVFQYNPKKLRRTVTPSVAQGGERGAEAMRLNGAPREQIEVELEIDAADQLETGDGIAKELGIYPQLSALEMLCYPKSVQVILNTVLLATGTIEVIPPEAPFTLFIWGIKRVVPVKLNSLTIQEEEYDPALNPIRATATTSLTVLNYNDYPVTHPGFAVFMAHQVIKEVMAVIGSVNNIPDIQL